MLNGLGWGWRCDGFERWGLSWKLTAGGECRIWVPEGGWIRTEGMDIVCAKNGQNGWTENTKISPAAFWPLLINCPLIFSSTTCSPDVNGSWLLLFNSPNQAAFWIISQEMTQDPSNLALRQYLQNISSAKNLFPRHRYSGARFLR